MSKFTYRKIVPEIIDDFNWKGEELEQNLEEIEWINRNLGGIQVSVKPVLQYIQRNLKKNITIADIGCGSGDVLKNIQLACHGITDITLIGLDANQSIINFAREKHFRDQDISFIHADVLNDKKKIPASDVYMLNLFLHHFEMNEIECLLKELVDRVPSLIVINDLQRSRLAYYLFGLLCKWQNASYVTINDGQLSILKGFNQSEMRAMGEMAEGYQFSLKWCWAFRWQLLIEKI